MRVEPLRDDDAGHTPFGVEEDLTLGKIVVERLARIAGAREGRLSLP
jgi:hypothetical protein